MNESRRFHPNNKGADKKKCERKRKISVTVTFRGTVEVSEATYNVLKSEGGTADCRDVDLPWDEVTNLDGEVDEAARSSKLASLWIL